MPFLHVRRSMAFNNLHFSPNIVKIVFIVGTKNSGKTTAAEYIVGELARLGYKVGTVKHIHHEFTIDTEGKDTYRMRKAGASMVVSISPSEVAVMRRPEDEDNEFKKVAQQMSSEGFDFLGGGVQDAVGWHPPRLQDLDLQDKRGAGRAADGAATDRRHKRDRF